MLKDCLTLNIINIPYFGSSCHAVITVKQLIMIASIRLLSEIFLLLGFQQLILNHDWFG